MNWRQNNNNNMKGEISKSMGIDTKPAHKFEINGFWLMLDPNADEATVQRVKDFEEACKDANERVKQSKQTCINCKHSDKKGSEKPCSSCLLMDEFSLTAKNNWEAK